jgi:hypothetical protein
VGDTYKLDSMAPKTHMADLVESKRYMIRSGDSQHRVATDATISGMPSKVKRPVIKQSIMTNFCKEQLRRDLDTYQSIRVNCDSQGHLTATKLGEERDEEEPSVDHATGLM